MKLAREDDVFISFGRKYHNFGAVAENDLSKVDVLDLGTNKEPSLVDRRLRLCVSDIGVSKAIIYSGERLFKALKVNTALL